MIKYLIFCWKNLNTPFKDLAEEYSLLTKMARRCAYDLSHAAYRKDDIELSKFFDDRANNWLSIFSPDGVKDYRHKLYRDVYEAERRVEKLREFCVLNGLNPENVDETLPF